MVQSKVHDPMIHDFIGNPMVLAASPFRREAVLRDVALLFSWRFRLGSRGSLGFVALD